MSPDWEEIRNDGQGDERLERIEVPGGWLYRTTVVGIGVALAFVPEPAGWREP